MYTKFIEISNQCNHSRNIRSLTLLTSIFYELLIAFRGT